jgi:hypothetical protein
MLYAWVRSLAFTPGLVRGFLDLPAPFKKHTGEVFMRHERE